MKCTTTDMEMGICILEMYTKKPDFFETLMRGHLNEEGTREQILKTFMLAAESMKAIIKADTDLEVVPSETVDFFLKRND